ncbi:TRAP transporter substrate-binding protein [Cellulomonas sp. P5_C6]
MLSSGTPRTGRHALVAAALGTAMLLAAGGCTAAQGADDPLTLRIGTDDGPDVPAADAIREFAREVADASHGRITVEPVWHAAGEGISDWDQAVAAKVVSGDLEMGYIPARAWDTEGVTSLRPLNSPFLITSDPLVDDIAGSELAEALMSGLPAAGVTGIGLVPEGLRHPFGFASPLLGPADYDGKTIRIATSHTTQEMFAALGAATNDHEPDESEHAGSESSFLLASDGTATGNVTFYPKVQVLVVNNTTYEALSRKDRDLLAAAADGTRTWVQANQPREADAAAAYCAKGGGIVEASDADLAALEAATRPVAEEIAGEPGNADVVAAIQERKDSLGVPDALAPCAAAPEPSAGTADTAAVDGVYRTTLDTEDFTSAGIKDGASDAAGLYTITLDDGTFRIQYTSSTGGSDADDHGKLAVDGDKVTFIWTGLNNFTEEFTWARDDAGTMTLTSAGPGDLFDEVIWTAYPWTYVAAP